ncbi:CSLREA domain-containing protein [Gemmatimonadota bacterium]
MWRVEETRMPNPPRFCRPLIYVLLITTTLVACDDEPAGPSAPITVLSTYMVNSTDDVDDGTCDLIHCSLREAIIGANNNPGLDTITFSIPGSGPHTIQLVSELPTISDPVVIDGYTQTGASVNTLGSGYGSNAVLMIELDGSGAGGGASGLHISAGGSTVTGLVINQFDAYGVLVSVNGGNTIKGNFIGTDITGTVDRGNSSHGVLILDEPDNVIGGSEFSARNVISGNDGAGIRFDGSAATGNMVLGNFIGTDITGSVGLGNTGIGVRVNSSANIIGGTDPGARNIISSNDISGIVIRGNSSGNVVLGNFVGTDVTGTLALGNTWDAVHVWNAFNNTIGGMDPGARNVLSGNGDDGVQLSTNATGNKVLGNFIGTDITGTVDLGNGDHGVVCFDGNNVIGGTIPSAANIIAFNSRHGFHVISGTGNTALGNSLHSNSGLGIALNDDGVTSNDPGDTDSGPNNLQNFPELTTAVVGNGNTSIEGTLNSMPNTEFRIEFFSNSARDPSGNGEGETFIGSTTVTTDGSGNVSITVTLPITVPAGYFITATATDPYGNTSEFSRCVAVN